MFVYMYVRREAVLSSQIERVEGKVGVREITN